MSETKQEFLERTKEYWNPGKTTDWQRFGVDLVIDRREGYYLYDMDGKRLIDVHLNGGTYNLGHRNPEVVDAVKEGMKYFDIGNHHFPSLMRTHVAEMLANCTPEGLQYTIYASGGGEAIDISLKCARHATQRRKFICIEHSYHGHTGLAVQVGDDRFSKLFLSDASEQEVVKVPFNDLEAMQKEIHKGDAACVIMETIPATYGFPLPGDGYLAAIKSACEQTDTLYIADEVQTGLMRCGEIWGIDTYGIKPDILVTSKGFSGGFIQSLLLWLTNALGLGLMKMAGDTCPHLEGAELGCIAAAKVLEISTRPEVRSMVHYISRYMRKGLEQLKETYSEFFIGIRQRGVVMGLEFNHPEGAIHVMKALFKNGVWAIFSSLDPKVLQFKPGILVDKELCDEILNRLDTSLAQAQASAFQRTSISSQSKEQPEIAEAA